jgi:hypothetical protein
LYEQTKKLIRENKFVAKSDGDCRCLA